MFDKTITLFNRYHSRLGDIWIPHVISGVSIITDKASIIAKYGAQSSDAASLLINYKKIDGVPYIGSLPYYPPKVWSQQTNNALKNSITINDNAQFFDFFVVGEDPTGVVNDDDYTNGFYDYMNNKNDYVYAITSVGDYSGLLPHFEISAR